MSKFWTSFATSNRKGETFADGHDGFWIPTGTGKTVTANAGNMTKSSVQPHGVNCTGSCSWKIFR